jgi:hypothetical protein
MRDYRKYDVWEKTHQLVLFVYKEIMPSLPKSEQYELNSQMKRSAYSIPILDIALGSVHELEYTALLVFDLAYISKEQHEECVLRLNEVKAKLINLIKSIRKNQD